MGIKTPPPTGYSSFINCSLPYSSSSSNLLIFILYLLSLLFLNLQFNASPSISYFSFPHSYYFSWTLWFTSFPSPSKFCSLHLSFASPSSRDRSRNVLTKRKLWQYLVDDIERSDEISEIVKIISNWKSDKVSPRRLPKLHGWQHIKSLGLTTWANVPRLPGGRGGGRGGSGHRWNWLMH